MSNEEIPTTSPESAPDDQTSGQSPSPLEGFDFGILDQVTDAILAEEMQAQGKNGASSTTPIQEEEPMDTRDTDPAPPPYMIEDQNLTSEPHFTPDSEVVSPSIAPIFTNSTKPILPHMFQFNSITVSILKEQPDARKMFGKLLDLCIAEQLDMKVISGNTEGVGHYICNKEALNLIWDEEYTHIDIVIEKKPEITYEGRMMSFKNIKLLFLDLLSENSEFPSTIE